MYRYDVKLYISYTGKVKDNAKGGFIVDSATLT
jgi:hypothetical protein